MTTQALPGVKRSGTLSGFLRRAGLMILVGALIGAAAGLLVTDLMPKRYTATASVLVAATTSDDSVQANSRTSGPINLDTEAQLVKSADVVTRAQALEPRVPRGATGKLVKDLHVSVPANTTVLNIAFTGDTPRLAQVAANAFARAYLDDRKATAQASLSEQVDAARSRVTALTDQLKALTKSEAGLAKGSDQYAYDEAQSTLLTNQIGTLNQSLISLESTRITPGRILTAAARPHTPSSPSRTLNLASGLAVGIVLGLLLGWLRVAHRRVVREAADLEHGIDLPAVADLGAPEPGALVALRSADGEAYRRLSILAGAALKQPGILVLSATGAAHPDGTVAANLAAALAESGLKVCLLRLSDEPSAGRGLPGVREIAIGRPETLRARFGGASTAEALALVRGEDDVLIVDAPCPTRTADAQTLAVLADAVLMIVRGGTRTGLVREAIEQFDAVAAPMLGIVYVHAPRSAGRAAGRRTAEAGRIDRVRLHEAAAAAVSDAAGGASGAAGSGVVTAARRPSPVPRPVEPDPQQPVPAAPTDIDTADEPVADEPVEQVADAEPVAEDAEPAEADEPAEDVEDVEDDESMTDDGTVDEPAEPADEPVEEPVADDGTVDEPAEPADEPVEEPVADDGTVDEPAEDVEPAEGDEPAEGVEPNDEPAAAADDIEPAADESRPRKTGRSTKPGRSTKSSR